MKKLFFSLVFLSSFFATNAQYQIDLTFDTPARVSGSTLCLKNSTGVSQKIFVNIYKDVNDTGGWGDIFLVYQNTNGVKNTYPLGSVMPIQYSAGLYTTSFNITISATNSPGGLDGQLYVQLLYAPNNINLQSSSYINYKINNLSAPSSASFCPGQTSASLTASGCSSYTWSPSTGLNTTTGATVIATPSTNTTYTVTGTASNGCTNTKTVAVTLDNNLTVTPTSATSCPTQGVTLTATSVSGATYSWSPATDLNTTSGATVIATPPTTTPYTVTSTKSGCILTKTIPVTVVSPCGATFANAINLGSFYTCPMWQTAVYNNSTANNYGNDYATTNTNGQASDDIYFKFYYDSYQGEQTNVYISTYGDDTNFDTYIHLLDANGNWLQSNDNTQDNPNRTYSTITRSISENYYYVVVEGKTAASGNFSLTINAGSDCARIGNIDASNTTGTLSISPNPSHDYLTITLPSPDTTGEIAIYTMDGSLIKTISTQVQSNTITVSDLTAGFYLLKVKQGDFIKTEKIIIN